MVGKRLSSTELRKNKFKNINKKIYKSWHNTKIKTQPFSNIIPNIITVMSMCAGLSAIKMALSQNWDLAVLAVLISVFLDAMDGRVARLLGVTSRFGEMMDSFSDVVTFGVAPAIVLYLLSVHKMGNAGWVAVLFFSVCMALRLARFNTSLIETELNNELIEKKEFFVGVPAPMAAMIGMFPMICNLHYKNEMLISPFIVFIFMIASGILMVSRIPTISIKKIYISQKMILPLMLCAVLAIGAIYTEPWLSLTVVIFCYMVSIPIIALKIRKLKKIQNNTKEA